MPRSTANGERNENVPAVKRWRKLDQLCEACSQIPFEALLDSSDEELGFTREHAFSRTADCFLRSACPFCALISHELSLLANEQPEASQDEQAMCKCIIRLTPAGPYNNFLAYKLVPNIGVRISIECWDQSKLAKYEVVGRSILECKWTGAYVSVRHPMLDIFAPSKLRRWLHTCDTCHEHDVRRESFDEIESLVAEGRFRVIDVVRGVIVTLRDCHQYFALSYVWGQAMAQYIARGPPRVPSNSDSTQDGMQWVLDWQKLPRTIQDAAALVRSLDERYLWVDALCINQSDSQDKAVLISKMGAIYENAYLTIIAAGGDDAGTGLHRLDKSGPFKEQATSIGLQSRSISLVPERKDLVEIMEGCKWNNRAWTYQERLLSPRSVIFTLEEVFFTCGLIICSETTDIIARESAMDHSETITRLNNEQAPLKTLYTNMLHGTPPTFRNWCEAMQEYSHRQLSHLGDRLDAFSGILTKFTPVPSPGDPVLLAAALCGLPAEGFWAALLWESKARDSSRIKFDARGSRCIPSWTWAGWSGGMAYYDTGLLENLGMYRVDMLDRGNIVVRPRGEHAYWEEWPFEPTLCAPNMPGAVTLHMWAKCVCCYLDRFQHQTYGVCWNIFTIPKPRSGSLRDVQAQRAAMQRLGSEHRLWIGYIRHFPEFDELEDLLLDMLIFRAMAGPQRERETINGILISTTDNVSTVERVGLRLVWLAPSWTRALEVAHNSYVRLK